MIPLKAKNPLHARLVRWALPHHRACPTCGAKIVSRDKCEGCGGFDKSAQDFCPVCDYCCGCPDCHPHPESPAGRGK